MKGLEMVDRYTAETLRRQGKTYKEIALAVGCSEIWCKQNLKDVPVTKVMTNEQLYQNVKVLMLEIEERLRDDRT